VFGHSRYCAVYFWLFEMRSISIVFVYGEIRFGKFGEASVGE
jgi:hypothetical protein